MDRLTLSSTHCFSLLGGNGCGKRWRFGMFSTFCLLVSEMDKGL